MKVTTFNQAIIDEASNNRQIIKSIKIPLNDKTKAAFLKFIGESAGNDYGYIYYISK